MSVQVAYHASGAEAETLETYSLTMQNRSTQPWTFYVYQEPPATDGSFFSLAWYASPFLIMPGSQATFEWDNSCDFVWGTPGDLKAGMTFRQGGTIGCSPDGDNATTFTVFPGPHLTSPERTPPLGSLTISVADNVPNNTYSVGIGMSGVATYATSASPNLRHIFRPAPPPFSCWIAAGRDVRVGTVLGAPIHQNFEVTFPPNVHSITMAFNEMNRWVEG